MRTATLILLSSLTLAFIAGCSTKPEASTDAKPTSTSTSTSTETEKPAEPTVFTTSDGKIVCPLMKAPIASPEEAEGYVDHEGVRYYVCCAACLKKGQEDPAALAEAAEKLK